MGLNLAKIIMFMKVEQVSDVLRHLFEELYQKKYDIPPGAGSIIGILQDILSYNWSKEPSWGHTD